MHSRQIKKPRGFTLIELLVAIGMIGVISTYVLADYAAMQRRADVRLQAYQFAATLRQAQNYALGAYAHAGAAPVGGWGVHIVNASEYYLFVDDGNYVFDAGDAIAEEKTLRHTVVFDAANHGDSFVFEPPSPTVYLNGANDGSITVTLQQADDAGNINTVTANAFGLVDVD